MITFKDYVAGWFNVTVSDILHGFPQTYERLSYALITCIDSNTSPASLLETSPLLQELRPEASTLGQGVIVKTKTLLAANCEREIFHGFDEIWFFPHRVSIGKPDDAAIVGPNRIDDSTMLALSNWLIATSCSFAMGGGTGLNYLVKARGLVRYLIGISMDQESIDEMIAELEDDSSDGSSDPS